MTHHLTQRFPFRLPSVGAAMVMLPVGVLALSGHRWVAIEDLHRLLITTIPLAVLAIVGSAAAGSRAAHWDGILGNCAYPLFLTHWPIAAAVSAVLLPDAALFDARLLPWSIPPLAALCWLNAIGIDRPLRTLRTRIRNGLRPSFASGTPDALADR